MSEDAESPTYTVTMTDEAFYAYYALPSRRVVEHVKRNLRLLESSPDLGRVYDPAYEAKSPPSPCRVLYCGHYGIYYRVDDKAKTVTVIALEDQRRNPLDRFSSLKQALNEPPEASKQ